MMKRQGKLSRPAYRFVQFLAWFPATFLFGRRVRRNEIRDLAGPFCVIANHECAMDFVNLIGLCRRPMRFVISYCIYNTLPLRGIVSRLGLIPKQQFQTKPTDLLEMRRTVQDGEPLVIFPAGLMCEDGLSTPIPTATGKFLKWLDVDVYAARTTGAYFVQPKWAKKKRPGRTYLDVYKLLGREELAALDEAAVMDRVNAALLFDAYREEEENAIANPRNRQIEGLHNVLYQCPHCLSEGSTETARDTIRCRVCGFEERSDAMGLLHKTGGPGEELRYVSDWSRLIREETRRQLDAGELTELSCRAVVRLLDLEKGRFEDASRGTLTLGPKGFRFEGAPLNFTVPIAALPTLPFRPGHHIELQKGDTIYRCVPDEPQCLMKFVNYVELTYENRRAHAESRRPRAKGE